MDFVIVFTAQKVKHSQSIFPENTVELSKHEFFLVKFKIDKSGDTTELTADFECKRPGMVNTHLPQSMMNLVIR